MQPGKIAQQLIKAGALGTENFTLFDIGCSGGIESGWADISEALRVFAFDPLVSEIQRLRKTESMNGIVSYIDAFVTGPDAPSTPAVQPDERPVAGMSSYARSSALSARALAQEDFIKEIQNSNLDVQMSTNSITVDEFCRNRSIVSVDFLKVDTDGYDLQVMRGALETLRSRNVLGVLVEMQFQGPPTPDANVFSNIDPLLREAGLTLFDLSPNHYSKAALPAKFVGNFTGQTISGQVLWSDALYLRDFCDPSYRDTFPHTPLNEVNLVKMLMLFELFGFYDCAVELLETHPTLLAATIHHATIRNAFAQRAGISDYDAHMATFAAMAAKREYALFPDGRTICAEGYLDQAHAQLNQFAFRPK